MARVYLGLGSNIEPRLDTLSAALDQLKKLSLQLLCVSAAYESQPFQGVGEGNYINLVAAVETELNPGELLEHLLLVERGLGRVRGQDKWGARRIDIDILAFGDQILKEPNLTIPHYDLANRDFFLIPLAQIAPEFCHPQSQASIQELILALPSNLSTRLYKLPWKYTL